MKNRVRLSDVAAAAGTSVKTASRIINGDERVSPETKRRVDEAIDHLGYRVDLLARSLRKGVDEAIGIVVPSIGDVFFASAIEEIEIVALERGTQLIIASNHNDPRQEQKTIFQFQQRRVAGMIITPNQADYSFLKLARMPVVFFDRAPRNFAADIALVDDIAGGAMATEHLLQHGHKHIAFISDDLVIPTSDLRLQGYKKALGKYGLVENPDLIFTGGTGARATEDIVRKFLRDDLGITAIFSARSSATLGVVKALHEAGRTDIALVSFGDFDMAEVISPKVTVIDHSARALGQLAIAKLFALLDGEPSRQERLLAGLKLIPRGSGEIRPPGGTNEN